MMKTKDLLLFLILTLQTTLIMNNFYLIVFFSLFSFSQLLILYNVEGLTLVIPDTGDQAPGNN